MTAARTGTQGASPPPAGIRIVREVQPPSLGSRLGRGLAVALGYLLIAVAVLAAVPALALLVLLVLAQAFGDGAPVEAWAVLAGLSAGAGVPLFIGVRLARGRRHMVLFLRRFGFDDASEALTLAVGTAMGRRWRLVTLDDMEVEAVGTPTVPRRLWGLGRWAFLLLLVLACAYGAYWWFGGGPDRIVEGIWDRTVAGSEESGANVVETIVAAIIVTLLVGIIVLALIVMFAVAVAGALFVGVILTWRVDSAVRRAEGSKALRVRELSGIRGVVDRSRAASRRIHAPRFVVVKVRGAIWQPMVRELARAASAVLVDVSEPTQSLVWEVDMLASEGVGRLVLIGRHDRVAALAGTQVPSGPAADLQRLLSGKAVLTYDDPDDRRGMKHFARSLNAALEASER